MCTVSYFPTPKGYILTSNRDENPGRETEPPRKNHLPDGSEVTYPRDVEKGGTWIAMDDGGRAACLLNGAFERHLRKTNYRMSRGLLIIEAFNAANFEEFTAEVNLLDIEPFTLILIDSARLVKVVWDGINKFQWQLDPTSMHLWSSATLYSDAMHSKKLEYLIDVTKGNISIGREAIMEIHGIHNRTPFILDREKVKTVSITQIWYDGTKAKMKYITKNQAL